MLLPKEVDACISGDFYVSYTFQQSFNNAKLAQCLVGSDVLTFQGSAVENRSETALLADQFGLPTNFDGSLALDPRVQSSIIDFNLMLRSDRFNNWWVQILAPVEVTSWELRACETDNVAAEDLNTEYAVGYMGGGAVAVGANTIKEALSYGFSEGYLADSDLSNNQVATFGSWQFCKQNKSALANLEARLGWDFWRCDNYHVGAYALVQAPTGSQVNAKNFFAPVVGGGQHWKLGGGVTAHYELWNCDDEQSLMAYFEGNVGHMFNRTQTRSFEFADHGCCLNRYSLLKMYNGTDAEGHFINGIDFATRQADVKIGAEGELKAELMYRHGNWKAGLGYGFYGRSHEEVCIKSTPLCNLNADVAYGFKGTTGDAFVVYPIAEADDVWSVSGASTETITNNASQSTFSICSAPASSAVDTPFEELDETTGGTVAVDYTQNGGADQVAEGTAVTELSVGYSSTEPVTFAADDVSVLNAESGAMPALLSHTVYGHVSYQADICGYQPEFTLGGEGEFRQSDRCCTLSRWGVWVGGQIGF
jgi:hypothetical protein